MRKEINTRYDVGDIVFGYYNRHFWKLKIDDVEVCLRNNNVTTSYYCTAITNSDITFSDRFVENELYSCIEEIIEDLKRL